MAPEPGIDEPPVCTVVIMPWARAASDQRCIFVCVRKGAEARFGEPDALLGDLAEIVPVQAGLEDHRAGMHGHAAGAVALETLVGGDSQRLDAFRIARTSGNMHFRGADRGCYPAMHIAF